MSERIRDALGLTIHIGRTTVSEIKRILIYRCGAIGDTIVSIPAIRAIRNHFKDAAMILMTATGGNGIIWSDEVLREFAWFDEYVTYNAEELWSVRTLALIAKVRRQRADMVIYLASDRNSVLKIWRDLLFFRVAGVRRFAACYPSKVTFWGRLKRSPHVCPSEVVRLLSCLRRRGIDGAPATFELPIAEERVRKVSQFLEKSGMDRTRPLIAMCPGSKQQATQWPIERYGEVGRRLIEMGGANIVIIGGELERAAGEKIGRQWPRNRWVNSAAHLDLLELAELLRNCVFYLGNDTGPMHLAVAVGTRCLGVFSAHNPLGSWHPYGDNHIVLRKNVPCQNCYLSTCVKESLRCLTDIGIEEVWSACRRMLTYR